MGGVRMRNISMWYKRAKTDRDFKSDRKRYARSNVEEATRREMEDSLIQPPSK